MSGSAGQLGRLAPCRGGWEGQLGRRVLYRGRSARIVHADLFRLVLRTEEGAPERVMVDECDWADVELLDSENGDVPESEVTWPC